MRGFALTAEALILAALAVIVIPLVFSYAVHLLRPTVEKSTTLEAVLCGKVLVLKNIGDYPATITSILGNTTELLCGEITYCPSFTVNPGMTVVIQLQNVYGAVSIAGQGFPAVYVKNECTG